jgi:hypothetical protein
MVIGKDELTIKPFSFPMHKTLPAATRTIQLWHREYFINLLDVRAVQQVHTKGREIPIICVSLPIHPRHLLFFAIGWRITQNTFQKSLAQDPQSLFHFPLSSGACCFPHEHN